MITIYINSFNRLASLKQLVYDLHRMDVKPVIIDNASTYPPLVDWLHSRHDDVEIILTGHNGGPRGWWPHQNHKEPFYGVCDPDIDLSQVPNDLFRRCLHVLQTIPGYVKAGPSIKYDDVPTTYPFYSHVVGIEKAKRKESGVAGWYRGEMDTTCFVARSGEQFAYGPALLAMPPYELRHLPFYVDLKNLDEEERFYIASIPKRQKSGLYYSTLCQDSGLYA